MRRVAVSVVVPTHDRHEQLARCLRSLAAAPRSNGEVEVIVVNDGGARPPAALVDRAAGGLAVRIIDQAPAGPGAARNTGAAAARGALLAFTDDDCEATPDWVEALRRRLAAQPQAVVGGRAVVLQPDNLWASASQLLIDHLTGWYNRDPDHARFVTSNNLAMSAETFAALGGFNTAFPSAAAEDREFAERALRAGRPLLYAPEAVVRHGPQLTGRRFLRQHYGYGRGAYRLVRIRRLAGGGIVLESPRFYVDLLRQPLVDRGLRLRALLALSQIAHTAGFVREALAQRD